jgi:transposase-like protein
MEYSTPFTFVAQGQWSPEELELVEAIEEAGRKLAREVTEKVLQLKVEDEVTAALGPARAERTSTQLECWCRRCATRTQSRFHRNGHYKRGLTTAAGKVTLRIPLIRCDCKGYVAFPWKAIRPRSRQWVDVTLDMVRDYLAGMSYRLTAEAVSSRGAVSISHLVVWRAVQEAGRLVRKTRALGACPQVVVLDEVYVEVLGEKLVFLVALAESGGVLEIWGPTARSKEGWRGFLDWLSQEGIGPERGLKGVVADGDSPIREAVAEAWPGVVVQECVWHVLERVREAVVKEEGPKSEQVKAVVAEAREVLMPSEEKKAEARVAGIDDMTSACRELKCFTEKHAGKTWADILSRSFYEATTYLREPYLPATNGLAERTIKELRRRIKTMDGFKSIDGSRNFLALWIPWHDMRLTYGRYRASLRRPRRKNLKSQATHPKLA